MLHMQCVKGGVLPDRGEDQRVYQIRRHLPGRDLPAVYESLDAYRVLRTTNPSPYMVYLHIDKEEIMSTSPETLVRLDQGRLVTFPVAGSRPRGRTAEEDKMLERELLRDEKELA